MCSVRTRSLVLALRRDVGDLLQLPADRAGALDDGAARDSEVVVLGVLVRVAATTTAVRGPVRGGPVHAVALLRRVGRARCPVGPAVLSDLLEHFGLQLGDRRRLAGPQEVVRVGAEVVEVA